MTVSSPPATNNAAIVTAHAVTTTDKGDKYSSLPAPLPCITILVHGVNDVGEAYAAQETGLCQGLNARLNRSHELGPEPSADLIPSSYTMPPATLEDKQREGIKDDPDAVYFRRAPNRKSRSPVIPFYWGSREDGGIDPQTHQPYIKRDNWHGQWTDRYGNRLDKNGAKNGGPFANATSTLNGMWSEGFNGKIARSEAGAVMASDPLHNLKKACPRAYMLLAAKRLAMLIKIIRNNKKYENVAINLLCHSQGGMVALTAHAMLAEEGGQYAADTLILQNTPYSFEETFAEFLDDLSGGQQQTTASRIKTLTNIIRYVGQKKSSTPRLEQLVFSAETRRAVAGPHWKPGKGAMQWVNGVRHAFTERDNRGKVYLYFCPHDSTVALMSVQGMGWNGVPDYIRTETEHYTPQPREGLASASGYEKPNFSLTLPVFGVLGDGFRQRVFTSRQVDGNPVLVGDPPGRYEMRSDSWVWPLKENSTTGNWSASVKQITAGAVRQINGEELHPKVQAVLTTGESGHAGKLAVNPIDGAIAIAAGQEAVTTKSWAVREFRIGARRHASPLTAEEIRTVEDQLPGQRQDTKSYDDRLRVVKVNAVDNIGIRCTYSTETANEARARWQNQRTDTNSYHSAIPANPAHAAGVTAYDLSLGAPLPIWPEEASYMEYLRAVADWRTDWKDMTKSKDVGAKKLLGYLAAENTGAIILINANTDYYASGILPSDIAKERLKLIANQTVAERKHGQPIN
jgi:hypothetical protein